MHVIDPETLELVKAPVASARGLPNVFYTDEDVFEIEKQAVFDANWPCIGFASDVPRIGDAKPVNFLGRPYLLVRDTDNNVRVFENVCRHRGMILFEKPTRTKGVIRCPYHSWCYGLDGSLKTTPHVGGPGNNRHDAMKRDELGLNEIRSKTWMEMVFINASGEAQAFEEANAELLQRWAEFADRPLYHGGANSTFKLDVACNWKLAVENYCESYHLPWIHPGLNSYSRLEDHYNILQPVRFSGQGTVVYNPTLEDNGRVFRSFSGLSDKWDTGAEYIALFPNTLIGVHRDHTFAIMLEPNGLGATREHIEIFYTCEEDAGAETEALRRKNAEMWKEIFVEDIFVVEGMQRGRSASNFDGGKFSPVMDEATHCFHDWTARQFDAVA